jgi:hypothetical protein
VANLSYIKGIYLKSSRNFEGDVREEAAGDYEDSEEDIEYDSDDDSGEMEDASEDSTSDDRPQSSSNPFAVLESQ